jgi:hypothetical protein
MAKRVRTPAARLRVTVDALPRRTRIAMLAGIHRNRIIVGAYTDPGSGGICPMLAAHRSGGRTSVASFARAWDEFTGAKRPRPATRRELRALRSYLEMSLLREDPDTSSVAELAAQVRRERAALPPRRATSASPGPHAAAHPARPQAGPRPGWAWLRPARRLDEYKDLLAAAEEQLSEQRAAEVLGERHPSSSPTAT